MIIKIFLPILGLFSLLTSTAHAASSANLAQAAWLAGCWSADNGEAGTIEMWMPIADHAMLGMARTVRDGKMREFEFMRIEDVDGKISYTAKPSRQAEGSFELLRMDADSMVFENLQRDFPQRVIYRLTLKDHLAARIEGKHNGVDRGIDYPMHRTSCDAFMSAGGQG